ncbi:hypothetical protein M2146_001187 [Lachnospiraceae bacterium PF1-22]
MTNLHVVNWNIVGKEMTIREICKQIIDDSNGQGIRLFHGTTFLREKDKNVFARLRVDDGIAFISFQGKVEWSIKDSNLCIYKIKECKYESLMQFCIKNSVYVEATAENFQTGTEQYLIDPNGNVLDNDLKELVDIYDLRSIKKLLNDNLSSGTTINKKDYLVHGVDFDGTLCEERYPEIGKPNTALIKHLIDHQQKGDKLILWTCREGKLLDEALAWCNEKGLVFDAVNQNLQDMIEIFGNDSRKLGCDILYDDKSYSGDKFEFPFVAGKPQDQLERVWEWCPECENEVAILWDVEKHGFKTFCTHCGKALLLCSMCDNNSFCGPNCKHNPVASESLYTYTISFTTEDDEYELTEEGKENFFLKDHFAEILLEYAKRKNALQIFVTTSLESEGEYIDHDEDDFVISKDFLSFESLSGAFASKKQNKKRKVR